MRLVALLMRFLLVLSVAGLFRSTLPSATWVSEARALAFAPSAASLAALIGLPHPSLF